MWASSLEKTWDNGGLGDVIKNLHFWTLPSIFRIALAMAKVLLPSHLAIPSLANTFREVKFPAGFSLSDIPSNAGVQHMQPKIYLLI